MMVSLLLTMRYPSTQTRSPTANGAHCEATGDNNSVAIRPTTTTATLVLFFIVFSKRYDQVDEIKGRSRSLNVAKVLIEDE
jgi:hypothetical protein